MIAITTAPTMARTWTTVQRAGAAPPGSGCLCKPLAALLRDAEQFDGEDPVVTPKWAAPWAAKVPFFDQLRQQPLDLAEPVIRPAQLAQYLGIGHRPRVRPAQQLVGRLEYLLDRFAQPARLHGALDRRW